MTFQKPVYAPSAKPAPPTTTSRRWRWGAPEACGCAPKADRRRGAAGREWHSPPGTSMPAPCPAPHAANRPAPTLAWSRRWRFTRSPPPSSVAGTPIEIKWPNDSVVAGAKLSGSCSRGSRRVIVGFGVNLADHPDERSAGDKHGHARGSARSGRFWTRSAAGVRPLGRALAGRGLADHPRAGSPPPILPNGFVYPHRQRRLGRGVFDGLDESGALRLRLADGSKPCRFMPATSHRLRTTGFYFGSTVILVKASSSTGVIVNGVDKTYLFLPIISYRLKVSIIEIQRAVSQIPVGYRHRGTFPSTSVAVTAILTLFCRGKSTNVGRSVDTENASC